MVFENFLRRRGVAPFGTALDQENAHHGRGNIGCRVHQCRPESGAVSSILPPRDTICRIVPEAQELLAQPRMSDNGITEIPGTRSRPCQLGPALMTLW